MIGMYDLFSDLFDGFDWFMQPTTYKEEKKCLDYNLHVSINLPSEVLEKTFS